MEERSCAVNGWSVKGLRVCGFGWASVGVGSRGGLGRRGWIGWVREGCVRGRVSVVVAEEAEVLLETEGLRCCWVEAGGGEEEAGAWSRAMLLGR